MKTCRILLIVLLSIVSCRAYADNTLERKTFVADSLYRAGKTDSALMVNDEIISIVTKKGVPSEITDAYTSRGVYLRSSGKLEEAAQAYSVALEHIISVKDDSEESRQSMAALYNNLSALYLDMKSPQQAEEYAVKAAQTADLCSDKSFKSQIYAVASSVFITRKRHDMAKPYLLKAIKLAEETRQPEAELNSITYYILVLFRTGAAESEYSEYLKRASLLAEEGVSFMSLANYYQILFYIQSETGNHAEAVSAANKILLLEGISNYPFLKYDVYNNLHTIYNLKHDYKNAYLTLSKAKELSDSLFNESKSKQIEELSTKYETARKELEIKKLNEEKQKSTVRTWFLIAALLFVTLSAIYITAYFLKSRKLQNEKAMRENEAKERQFEQMQRKTEQRLTKEYIGRLEKERTRLAGELHDGICNDLYALEVNIRSAKQITEEWFSSLTQARENIRRVSHELLPPEFKEAGIDRVIQNYIESMKPSGCHIEMQATPEDCNWSVLPENLSLNIYRIVQEAVANSLKHSNAKHILVKMEWILPCLVVSVCDDGTGMENNQAGAGKRTIQERAKAINAAIDIESNYKGTRISIRIPIFT